MCGLYIAILFCSTRGYNCECMDYLVIRNAWCIMQHRYSLCNLSRHCNAVQPWWLYNVYDDSRKRVWKRVKVSGKNTMKN